VGSIQNWCWKLHRIQHDLNDQVQQDSPNVSSPSHGYGDDDDDDDGNRHKDIHGNMRGNINHRNHTTKLSAVMQQVFPFLIAMRDLFFRKQSQIDNVDEFECVHWLTLFIELLHACEFFTLKIEQDIHYGRYKSSRFPFHRFFKHFPFAEEHLTRFGKHYVYGLFFCCSSVALLTYGPWKISRPQSWWGFGPFARQRVIQPLENAFHGIRDGLQNISANTTVEQHTPIDNASSQIEKKRSNTC
ncbi:hypothetical protein RFI_07483, partial [Reticulomyxa filosa]